MLKGSGHRGSVGESKVCEWKLRYSPSAQVSASQCLHEQHARAHAKTVPKGRGM